MDEYLATSRIFLGAMDVIISILNPNTLGLESFLAQKWLYFITFWTNFPAIDIHGTETYPRSYQIIILEVLITYNMLFLSLIELRQSSLVTYVVKLQSLRGDPRIGQMVEFFDLGRSMGYVPSLFAWGAWHFHNLCILGQPRGAHYVTDFDGWFSKA